MRQWLIKYLLRSVVRVSIPEDVLRQDKKTGAILLGGIALTDIEKRALNAEAKAIKNMRIWSVINETIKQQCYERGWRDSTTIEHLNTAKIMYNVLDTQQSIVNSFENMVR